ncbi:MAG: LPS assembly protein LptD [Candidatus Omnitrophota bacterium]
MSKLKALIIVVFSVFSAVLPSFAAVDDDLSKVKAVYPIIVNGDKVELFEESGAVSAEGNVSIDYGDVKLTCDRIELNTKTRQALCEGNVRIEQTEKVLTGDRIRYDFINKKGEILGGELDAFPWFAHAEETGKVGENEYLLKKGCVTTCDLDEPHYRIAANEIRVFPNEKVIAKNVVFYIGKVPVLWLPYYYHPIIQSRAKVQFIPGWNSDWGYFLLSAWRFYIKGNSRVDVLLDYRTEKGFAEGADIYYNASDFNLTGLGEGLFRFYFIEQNDWGTYRREAFRDENNSPELRKRFQWKHRIEFDPRTVGMVEFNKMSDEYVLKDYFYNEYEENNPVPNNYVSIISDRSNYTFNFNANKRFHDFYTVTQKLPEFKLIIPDQRLWETNFYYGAEYSATRFEKEYAFEKNPPEKVNRLDTWHRLSYVTGIGPVNLVPFGTFQETVYDQTKWSGHAVARAAFGVGLDVFSRFHRIYDVKTNYLGFDINGLRHIIVPRAGYFHRHQPTVDRDNLYQMDVVDSLEKENFVLFSLENKLQTKRHAGNDMISVDFIRSIVSIEYLFRVKKREIEFEDGGQFRNLKFDVEISPYDWFFIDSQIVVAPKNQALSTASIETTIKPTERFQMATGYRYEKMDPDSRNQFTFDMRYRINPKWAVGLYERIDIQGGSIEEQQISLIRDLHCWELELVYDVDGSNFLKDDFTFWFAFKIKAFPDLPIGLSRSFNKRPPGSLER